MTMTVNDPKWSFVDINNNKVLLRRIKTSIENIYKQENNNG